MNYVMAVKLNTNKGTTDHLCLLFSLLLIAALTSCQYGSAPGIMRTKNPNISPLRYFWLGQSIISTGKKNRTGTYSGRSILSTRQVLSLAFNDHRTIGRGVSEVIFGFLFGKPCCTLSSGLIHQRWDCLKNFFSLKNFHFCQALLKIRSFQIQKNEFIMVDFRSMSDQC